jgi:allantoate deiminase
MTAREMAAKIIARCGELALCSEVPGEITRRFLCSAMHRVHALVGQWMRDAGMTVRVDAAGNLRGVLPAASPNKPRLVIGSHLDTIVNAGPFDGILGVVMGVALVEAFARGEQATQRTGHPSPLEIEVIGFSEEEGVRFSQPFLGSLACVDELNAALLERTDREGVTVAAAIRDFGLDPRDLPDAILAPSVFGYLEFHIEQGPILESENRSLGVVDAIAGQTRMEFIFTGHANHAGTTPMGPLRHDALAAAAQWIVEVERHANGCPGLVATVGKVESSAGAGNVIAGRFIASLDVRHPQNDVRQAAVQHFVEYASIAAASRGVSVAHTTSIDQPAVPLSSDLSAVLARAAADATGMPSRSITSGAGHDAMILARRVPAAILFLRSPGGLSHHPDESVLPDDVAAAFAAGFELLRVLRNDKAVLDHLTESCARKAGDLHA